MANIKALVTRTKKIPATVESISVEELPKEIKVKYSTLNYKDALVVMGVYPGLKPPMISGIDLVGTVESTTSNAFKEGDEVVINGFGTGTDHFGGFAEKASVRNEWLMPLPKSLSALDAAKIGTAGYTAMLCVDALRNDGITPDHGEIVVSGATGGVGSIATVLLSELGYKVAAITGKPEAGGPLLTELGASSIVPRSQFENNPKPLAKEIFAGAVDTVGGVILTNIITMIKHSGTVAACGLAGGMDLKGCTVAPFILRGVSLRGIDSCFISIDRRKKVYETYAPLLINSKKLEIITQGEEQIIGLDQVPEISKKMLDGQIKGRYVVEL